MPVAFTPEPNAEERAALVAALALEGASAGGRPAAYASAWRRAAIAENASGGAAAQQARGDAGVVEP